MSTILISGICGFVGSSLARRLLQADSSRTIFGFDNFSRPGSKLNEPLLSELGIKVYHSDVRSVADIESMPRADWVIDAAANPSVLAGVDGVSTSRDVVDINLYGTVNLLEYARRHEAGFILLSSSRVYSINGLKSVPLKVTDRAFVFDEAVEANDVSSFGLTESFSTSAPISLYGSTKLSSEVLAAEYHEIYKFPVWINRAGVLAGAGQFGRPDQGIFTYWINAYRERSPLRYIGFSGSGHQFRDCLHPHDLAVLVDRQMRCAGDSTKPRIVNIGGGKNNAMSLKQLSDWCAQRFGPHEVTSVMEDRMMDVPWVVMNSGLAEKHWDFQVTIPIEKVLNEIAEHSQRNPGWLRVSSL